MADDDLIHRGKPIFVGQPESLVDEALKLSGKLNRAMPQELALTFCDDLKRVVDGLYLKN